ncbi:putative methyltransferase [Colletotrichum spinosum]|uniref:Putative methyltransferase n=1 Tax=Colletotrichum spinosum TaxID=1347390 RepID=A0A4R8Q050_9PEZI|nr:putative methyltransferase [Colletotrichum spinosum]
MAPTEQTFSTFSPEQAAAYAKARGSGYSPVLYQAILDYHSEHPRDVLLDVGSGPGTVVFDILSYFKRAYGCDTGFQMIEQAKQAATEGGFSKEQVVFKGSAAEQCADARSTCQGEVDVITVAMAAHWFDMSAFYKAAAKSLRPGGTLAIWTCSSMFVHPSVPNREKIQDILSDLEDGMLAPHVEEGNTISRNADRDLELPWDDVTSRGLFGEGSFKRVDWDLHGIPSAPKGGDGTPGPFLHEREATISEMEQTLSSASVVIRWRGANPDQALTDEDVVTVTARRLQEVMGVSEKPSLGHSTTLLLLRR